MEAEKQENEIRKTPSGNPDQKWIQDKSFRFDNYDKARTEFVKLSVPRKRLRARAGGFFDVVVYKPLKEPK